MRNLIKIIPLGIKAEKITSLLEIARGFMFSGRREECKLFILPTEMSADIHMLFVFFKLIIVWVDKNKKITYFSIAKPFLFYKIHRAKYVLEIPYDKKILKKLKKGMRLGWK